MIKNLVILNSPFMPFSWLKLCNVQKVCNSEGVREKNAIFQCTVPFQKTFFGTMSAAKVNMLLPKDTVT